MRRSIRLAVPLAALAVVAGSAVPAAAQSPGTTAAVGGGQTTLRLDAGTAGALAANGVCVELVGAATASSAGVAFPVTGGAADPATLLGSVRHAGSGLRFVAGDRRVTLRNFTYTVRRNGASLSARVGGGRLRILELDLSGASVARDGLTDTVTGITATLSDGAAAALNDAFRVNLFAGGLPIGTVDSQVTFAEAILTGGATTLALDPAAAAALGSLGISAAPIDPASAGGGGLSFPITGGRLDAATLAGAVTHGGGILLTKGTRRVALQDFTISTDGTPYLSAVVRGQRVRILDLDVSGLSLSVAGGQITAGGVVARLTATAAKALNQAFATKAFAKGLVLGTATVAGELR